MLRLMAAAPTGLTSTDERHHEVGPEPWWNESWYFDFATIDGTLGGYVRIGLYPNQGAVWYWACVVGEGRPLVTVDRPHRGRPARARSSSAARACGRTTRSRCRSTT